MKAWTYSSLNQFETCPRRYYLTRVSRQVEEPQTEATLWGTKVHAQLEAAIRDSTPLPKETAHLQEALDALADKKGERQVEFKLCVNKYFVPCEWDHAWCRGIVDLGIIGPTKAILIDWKTGRRRPGSAQLALYAAMLLAHKPELEKIQTAYVWTKENAVDVETYLAADIPTIWQEFLPRVQRLERAYEKETWLPKPSGLCRKWCPVGKELCEFCGER